MISLVTGAAGFVGSHLCQALLREGHEVVGSDNLMTGDISNLSTILDDDRFRFIESDASETLPDLERVDIIFHFASPASPIDYAERPLSTLRVNSRGTELCCELAARHGARILYASTSEVYGDPLEHPQREDYFGNVNSIGPRSCYDEAKRYGEAVIAAYRRTAALDGRMVRIFNTYGPRMRRHDGRVVPTFINEALSGQPLTVFGDGTQTRSLCYVDDLIEAILRFAAIDDPAYWVVNIGNDEEVTVLEIARTISELCGVPMRIRHEPLPENDPRQRRPDLTRARALLKWRAHTPMSEGLARTIAWFKRAVPA
ncbi:MAG: NAD-dependent epimerase/dehydratase family protein [Candidatus Eremiobacteraeota bacterium]|nr:NAD-dependent epimerase/dehydratase family protein [Candidatus Eremiobacteraeota bacterium]